MQTSTLPIRPFEFQSSTTPDVRMLLRYAVRETQIDSLFKPRQFKDPRIGRNVCKRHVVPTVGQMEVALVAFSKTLRCLVTQAA